MSTKHTEPPKKVTLGEDTVTVEFIAKLGRFICNGSGGYRVSGTYQNDKVKVVPYLDPARERDVVLHELMHKVWEKAGLSDWLSSKTEELVIGELAGWMVVLLRENPDLIEYLVSQQ